MYRSRISHDKLNPMRLENKIGGSFQLIKQTALPCHECHVCDLICAFMNHHSILLALDVVIKKRFSDMMDKYIVKLSTFLLKTRVCRI